MTWSTVRDNHLVFWGAGAWVINPDNPPSSFTLEQQARIEAALELLYTRSPTFKAMIDGWIASGGKLQIGATDSVNRSLQFGSDPLNRYILINFDRIESQNWVNDLGELVSDRLEIILAHEMIHMYKGYRDVPDDTSDANKNGASYDYAGDTVRYQNKIIAELGADFALHQQVSYGSVSDSFAAYLGLVENVTYTNGEAIDVWRRGSDGDDTLDHSNRTAQSTTFGDSPPQLRDLVFGFAGNDTINGGLGNDHLFGGADNDILIGGTGNDQLWGGTLNEHGRADGTDTARYQSAPAGITINLNGGFGVPVTVQDGQGGTDTLHSIERIEGSAHADSLVLSDLTQTIASDFDYIDLGSGTDTIDLSALSAAAIVTPTSASSLSVTLGGAVLEVRNVEQVIDETGTHTLALGGETGARVDGAGGVIAWAGSLLFSYSGFETIVGGSGNDRMFGGEGGHYVGGGGVNYLEGSGGAILESTTGDTYFSLTNGGTIISGAGNDYIEVSGSMPVTIRFGVGSGHDMLGSYFNDVVYTDFSAWGPYWQWNGTYGFSFEWLDKSTPGDWVTPRQSDTIEFVGLMPDDVELIWDYVQWDNYYTGTGEAGYPMFRQGEAAIRIKSTGETLYLGILSFEKWIDGGRDEINPQADGELRLQMDGSTSYMDIGDNASDDIRLFKFEDGISRSLFDLFYLFGTPSTPLPPEVKAAADLLSRIAAGAPDLNAGGAGDDNLDGSGGDDDMLGGDGNDDLDGGAGNDFLRGGGGNDVLAGGGGSDSLEGGAGLDTASYAFAGSAVTVSLASAGLQDTIGAGVDSLSNIENLVGSGHADTLTGDANANVLNGGSGNDLLTGGAGHDTLTGGSGRDTFRDTAAGLNGDTVTDLAIGDKIVITDANLATFTYWLSGNTLTFSNGSLTLANVPVGTIVASDAAEGGVQLTVTSTPAAGRPASDFNGDGRCDILWRNSDGTVTDWLGTVGGFAGNGDNAWIDVPLDWQVVGTGDFNGDGRDDILWRNSGGTVTDWLGLATGGFVSNHENCSYAMSADWQVVGTGDFNGDGRDDILWRNRDGTITDWLGTANAGFTPNSANAWTVAPAEWHVVGTGDFNGDGRDDILWRNADGTITDWLGLANGGLVSNHDNVLSAVPNDWHVVGTGDFNGDGKDDILWRNDNGTLTDWLGLANGGFVSNHENALFQIDSNWHVAGIGDYNGDGLDDVLWRTNSGGVIDWFGMANGSFAASGDPYNFAASWQVQPNPAGLGLWDY